MLVFDCETGPLPDEILKKIEPEFKPDARLRDPKKILASIDEKRAVWSEKAALHSTTGQILAIGYEIDGKFLADGDGRTEQQLVRTFWQRWSARPDRFVGFNIKGFDLPYLFQRSVILGVEVPSDLLDGRYWSLRFVDLQERWLCFGRDLTGHSLDAICKACGLGAKNGSGADFAKLWATDRPKALEYLKNDISLCANLAKRLGVQ